MLDEQLKSIRKFKKITQDDVANFLGVKRQTYSAYERGISIPDANTLNKLAEYFVVSTDYLLGITNDPTPANKKGPSYTDEQRKIIELSDELEIDELNRVIEFAKFLKFSRNQ